MGQARDQPGVPNVPTPTLLHGSDPWKPNPGQNQSASGPICNANPFLEHVLHAIHTHPCTKHFLFFWAPVRAWGPPMKLWVRV